MGEKTALLVVLISVVVVGLFTTSQAFIASNIHMCPHSFANDTQVAFGLSNRSAYVQLGQTHRIPCLPYSQREGESPFIAWYKLNESTDIREKENERLVSYNRDEFPGNHGPRYSLAYDFGLLIKDVEESDGGKYLCEVIWRDTEYIKQEETINIQVIGHTLPHGSEAVSEASSTASLHRGRRQTLPCECVSQTPDVVYWSTGEGVTTDTQIIGARFSDGATLQIQHGADYNIGIDASLTVNSLNDLQDTQRFWCHVFLSDGVLHSCSTDVQIQGGNPSFVLTASPTEFYLPEGFPQVLPCRRWTPGDVMCEVRWIHEHDESSQRVVLSYNLSTDTVQADSDYDLASDFGLRIKSVKPTHAGRYTCYIEDGSGKAPLTEALDTHVIGDSFPASPYTGNMSSSVTVTQGQGMTLPCECAQQSADASILAVYWSKGEGKNSDTDVIAARLANRSLLNSKNNGFSISSNWSLSMNSLNDSSSFRCHAFRSDDTLSNCHTGVQILQDKELNYTYIFFIVPAVAVIINGLLALLWCTRKWSFTESPSSDTTAPTADCFEDGVGNEERHRVMDKLYVLPALFLNLCREGVMVRERITSEREIFDTQHRHVIIDGGSGSGKSTFLLKLECDHEKMKSKLGHRNIEVVTKAVNARKAIERIQRNVSHHSQNSSVLLLIDDCHSREDIENILEDVKRLCEYQLHVVMTTRSSKLAQHMSKQCDLRHVTIAGFSSDEDINRYLWELQRMAGNETPNTQEFFLNLVKGHRLPQNVALLPGFWKMLFELRHKTEDIRPRTLSCLISTKFRCMFDSKVALTEPQNRFLANLGKEGLSGMIDGCENVVQVSCENACTDSINGIEMGLLCYVQESNTNGNESSPLLTGDSKVTFTQDIFQEFCAGIQVAQNAEEWMEKITVDNWEKLANVLVFAGNCGSNDDRHAIVCQILSRLTEIINQPIQEKRGSLKSEIQLQKLTELFLEVNYDGRWQGKLNKEISLLFPEGQLQFWEISSHILTLLSYFLKYTPKDKGTQKLRSVKLFCIDEKLNWDEFKPYAGLRALEDTDIEQGTTDATAEAAAARQQKELQESQKDRLVPHALQSGDKCYSSNSATDFARYLPDQEYLENIVLLGPVLGSQQIRDLVHNIDRLKHLKLFDLRFNNQTDDGAFEKIMTQLSACKALTDLRLSLYKVTTKGFNEAKVEMEKDATLLNRLKTLYLVHGSLTQSFEKFLTDIIKYMDNLQRFHVSALVESSEQGIPDKVVKAIHQNLDLNELIVDNKDALMRRQLGEPQLAKGATTSSQDSHVVDMETQV